MAGTFLTVPPQLTQLYTIHGLRHGKNVVVTYCLLTNKRQNIYVEIRQQVGLAECMSFLLFQKHLSKSARTWFSSKVQ